MTRWEYDTVHVAVVSKYAEDMGRNGWEMVCAVGDFVWFKRPLPPEQRDATPHETPC